MRNSLLFCLCFGGLFAADLLAAVDIPLKDFSTALNTHPEFPHAVGALASEADGWRIDYDFSDGGHGIGLRCLPKAPFWADSISFEARHGIAQQMCVIVCDATGQCLRKVASPVPDRWQRYRCGLRQGWIGHWGGANDGVVHQPVRRFEITLQRLRAGAKSPEEKGSSFIRSIAYEPADRAFWTDLSRASRGVRYPVTTFAPGDVFSAGPRAFFRTDRRSRYDGGELELDFSRPGAVALVNDIPIWGAVKELLLTVEAPAASAGLSFDLVCRVKGKYVTRPCGVLRTPEKGESAIYQTFSVPGFASLDTKRLVRLVIGKGSAKGTRFRLTPVRLEAVAQADRAHPPLVAVPPVGPEQPRTLTVGFLNLSALARTNDAVRVTLTDWEGRALGSATAPFPVSRPGERAFATVPLPPGPQNLNFVSYACELLRNGRPEPGFRGWTTSWTRPLADAGSPEKIPDSPWGFGVYIHRSEDFLSFESGYASPTNAAANLVMEKRAALAQAAGIKWERCEFKPGQANYAKGRYDFTYWDRLFAIADRHGLSCLGLWSHYFPTYDKAYTQTCYDDYIETLRVAADRYRNRILNWEIWNEPNISFWTGPKDDYRRLVNAAWDVLKAASPTNRVVAFSMAGLGLDFIDQCLAKTIRFDDIAIHPYRGEPQERAFLADLAAVTNRSRGTRLWLTEMGWPTGCGPNTYSEIQQAAYYARAYMTAAGSGCVHSIYGYNFIDDGFNVWERENNFGVLRRDLTPKPSYRAVAQVCRSFLRGPATIVPVALGEGVTAWRFQMDGKSALWADRDVSVRVETEGVSSVRNLMGEGLSAPAATVEVRVGPLHPVFFSRPLRRVTRIGEASRPCRDEIRF